MGSWLAGVPVSPRREWLPADSGRARDWREEARGRITLRGVRDWEHMLGKGTEGTFL